MCNLNPTETSTCRRCQSDSGRATLPFWAAASLWLVTHTHPGEEGIRPLPPSPPVLCLASFHPSSPPLCPHIWCTARGRGWNSVKPARWGKLH